MQSSKYARQVPTILAETEQERERDDKQPDQDEQEPEKVVYIYPLEGGGVVFTETPIEEDESAPRIVESGEPETDQRPIQRKDPPYFLHFVLLLLLFICLDSADTTLTALFTPTATITVIPQQQALTTSATFPIGTGPGDVTGRVLPVLTLSQSQTEQATGRGRQDARPASGTLTFYNGSFSSQTIEAGTVYTGSDGVQVATDQTVTVPAAIPGNPPQFGQAFVSAHAIQTGANGNIQAGDISVTTSTLQVKNSQFQNGQDARDFTYVTKSDLQQAIYALTSQVQLSEQGALSGQLQQGEALSILPCKPSAISNHQSGEEARSVTVTVSARCRGVAYEENSLQRAALQLVHSRLTHLNTHYQLIGAIQITQRATTLQNGSATLTASLHGVWVYQMNKAQIKTLVAGKPRLAAIQLLSKLPGVQKVSIAGISENSPLPDDLSHIHLLIYVER